jgi:Gpi18-like mannosyltransferase
MTVRAERWIVSVLCVGLLVRLALACYSGGTNDARMFQKAYLSLTQQHIEVAYSRDGVFYNQPPLVIGVILLAGKIAEATGASFAFVFRSAAVASEFGTFLLLASRRRAHGLSPGPLYMLYALNPALILLSGVHGNTDPFATFFSVIALVLFERGQFSEAVRR